MQLVHVSPHGPDPGNETVSFNHEPHAREFSELILVPVARRQRVGSLAQDIYEHVPARVRRRSRIFFLRCHRDESDALTRVHSPEVDGLELRFPTAQFYVVHLAKAGHTITPVGKALPIRTDSVEPLLATIRSAELQVLGRQPSALLPAGHGFHYRAAGGTHYRGFLRVGTALQFPRALDAVCFWLSSAVEHNTVALVDSPTLIALGLGLAQYLRDQNLSEHRNIVTVDVLEVGTANPDGELEKRLAVIGDLAGRGATLHALCIGSVVSSGDTLRQLADAAQSAGFTHSAVVLYSAANASVQGVTALAPAPPDVERLPAPCTLCASTAVRSILIPISPVSLHIEISSAVSRQRITQQFASRAAAFATRYAGSGTILAHHQEKDGHLRHHAVSVDVTKMFGVKEFRKDYQTKLEELRGSIDLILCPEHDAAAKMAAAATNQLGLPAIVCDENHLSALTDDQQQQIRSSKSLLILDDVVISGDRLRGYRQFLFELGRTSGDVHVLVALARPTSTDNAAAIRNLADQMTNTERSFHAIEEVLLPNWDESECPWCVESRAINAYPGKGDDLEFSTELLDRHELLTYDLHVGLQDGLFWSADGTRMPLGDGSILALVTL